MYQGGVYGQPGPIYGMAYGYDPRMGEAGPSRGRQERETAPVKFTEGKLFIGGVEANIISKDDLVQYCSQWGEVADAVVMDRKGYGFVTFADPKAAMTFLEKRVHELKGRRLDAKAAVPKAHLGTAKLTKKMFVGGTGDLTDQDFKDHFSQFGEIEDAAVVRREGLSRGFGFVTFADEISVEKCLLVNHFIKGRKVELKRAVPKDEVGAAQAAGAMGGRYGPQPQQMMQQQFYPMPYAPGPGPYGLRPTGFPPPGAAAMHMGADPYAAWYGMGYVPYYPAAGMYPGPYGMMPQPGMAPYGGMPYMAPGMASPRMQQQPGGAGGPSSSSGGGGGAGAGAGSSGGAAGSSGAAGGSSGASAAARGPGRSEGGAGSSGGGGSGTEAAAGSSGGGGGSSNNNNQQQQQGDPHGASPAGPSGSSEGLTEQQQRSGGAGGRGGTGRRASPDPAAASSRAGVQQQQQQHVGAVPGSSTSGPGSQATSGSGPTTGPGAASPGAPRRAPIVTSFPTLGGRPSGTPSPQRGVVAGPGVIQLTGALLPPGVGIPAALPHGFAGRGPAPGLQQQQQQQPTGSRGPQQQQQQKQQ